MKIHNDEVGSSRSKRPRQHETMEEVLLPQVHHEFLLWEGCNRDAKSRYNTRLGQLIPRYIYSPCIVNSDVLNKIGYDGEIDDMLRIKLREARLDEEFRLGGRAHNLTLLEFTHRLGLYQAVELEEEGKPWFISESYFYYQNPNLRAIHKMIIYGLYQRMTGYDKIQKNDLWILSMFEARHQNGYANVAWIARKCRVLTKEVVRSLSALIYYRDPDTITLRDLIDSDGKLIEEDQQPGVPRVGIPRPPRASM
uniref:Uncharacterized protein n=1 Tax=Tanacetum cinerariifolium TaxID=118510 RepID=A0A699HQN3_TANCI|nr:hypothetical protein [Tanacetum cinerariifolium]